MDREEILFFMLFMGFMLVAVGLSWEGMGLMIGAIVLRLLEILEKRDER